MESTGKGFPVGRDSNALSFLLLLMSHESCLPGAGLTAPQRPAAPLQGRLESPGPGWDPFHPIGMFIIAVDDERNNTRQNDSSWPGAFAIKSPLRLPQPVLPV